MFVTQLTKKCSSPSTGKGVEKETKTHSQKFCKLSIPKSWSQVQSAMWQNNDPESCNVRMRESLFSSKSVIFIVSPCTRSQMHLLTNRNCYQTTTSNGSDIWRPVSGIDVRCSRRVNLTPYGISLNIICCPPTRLILRLITQIQDQSQVEWPLYYSHLRR